MNRDTIFGRQEMNVSFHALFRVDYRFHIGRVRLVGNKRKKIVSRVGDVGNLLLKNKREKINKYKIHYSTEKERKITNSYFSLGGFEFPPPTPILSRPVACVWWWPTSQEFSIGRRDLPRTGESFPLHPQKSFCKNTYQFLVCVGFTWWKETSLVGRTTLNEPFEFVEGNQPKVSLANGHSTSTQTQNWERK